jgi:hypothetical protein
MSLSGWEVARVQLETKQVRAAWWRGWRAGWQRGHEAGRAAMREELTGQSVAAVRDGQDVAEGEAA